MRDTHKGAPHVVPVEDDLAAVVVHVVSVLPGLSGPG